MSEFPKDTTEAGPAAASPPIDWDAPQASSSVPALVPQFEVPNDTIEDLFTYHAPEGDQAERYTRIRAAAKTLAYILLANCPAGPDRIDAMRHIRQAVHFANASIATKNAADRFVCREWDEAHPRWMPERTL